MKNVERLSRRGNNEPVRTRRNVELTSDPYISDEHLPENSVCKRCGDVYMSGRWYDQAHLPTKPERAPSGEVQMTLCPACHKYQDRMPGGVLKLTGAFIGEHQEEIMNLIRNETSKAQSTNPLERVMSMDSGKDRSIEITTTNEKLAQRIGRALHKAYDGQVEYKWSEDTKLARVNWHREA